MSANEEFKIILDGQSNVSVKFLLARAFTLGKTATKEELISDISGKTSVQSVQSVNKKVCKCENAHFSHSPEKSVSD